MPTVCISKIKFCSASNYVKRLLLVLWVIAFGFVFLASSVASADTSLMMTSEAEDYIGQGLFYYYSSSEGDFSALRNYDNGVSLSFHTPDYSHWWYLDFAAPNNNPLAIGTYLGATRFSFQNADKPGLSVDGDGRGCNTLTGSFKIKEVTYGPNDDVLSFWATFEQHCEGLPAALRGEIRYNADSPNSVTGIKSTSSPSFSGQSITFTANVAGAGGVPTGTVFFEDGHNTLGSVLLSGSPASATFTTSALSIGTHSIIAVYSGNANFEASSSAVLNQVVEVKGATILMMDSDPGDYIGRGQTYNYSLADGIFVASRNYDNGVSLSFHTPDYSHWWYLDFAAPNNNSLAVGTYMGAMHFPSQDADKPGLSVYGDGRGCNTITGSFKIKEVTYGPNDDVLSFWATFEQHFEGLPAALNGDIRFHAHVPSCNVTFTDVPSGYWAEYYIKEMYCRNITSGCSQNPLMYCSENNVTRAQMAVFIIKGMGETTSGAAYNTYFNDIADDSFAPYINRMKELGITIGCGTRLYCPNTYVTRAQMAVFIIKGMGETLSTASYNTYFNDLANDASVPYINRMKELGITTGCGTKLYCSNSNVTRAQMAVFLTRAFLQ